MKFDILGALKRNGLGHLDNLVYFLAQGIFKIAPPVLIGHDLTTKCDLLCISEISTNFKEILGSILEQALWTLLASFQDHISKS